MAAPQKSGILAELAIGGGIGALVFFLGMATAAAAFEILSTIVDVIKWLMA